MGKMRKAMGWLFILALLGYVAYSIMAGSSSESPTANVVLKLPDCMDSDGGKNYNVYGETYKSDERFIHEDYCEGEVLVEYFCNNQYPDKIRIPCDCFKGACR